MKAAGVDGNWRHAFSSASQRISSGVVAVALILVCGWNLLAAARRVLPQPRAPAAVPADLVLRHEQRMADVRRALERRGIRGTVGYLSDFPGTELAGHHDRMEQYFLTQFALVPCVVDADAAACGWIVTNLRTTSLAERLPSGFRVVEDFGHGVALLEKVTP